MAYTILVVEHRLSYYRLVKRHLNDKGHDAERAATPQEALRFFDKEKHYGVLADHDLRDNSPERMNGLELLRRLRKQGARVTVLMTENHDVYSKAQPDITCVTTKDNLGETVDILLKAILKAQQ